MIDFQLFLESYIEAALWSSTDISEEGEMELPLDETHDIDDIAPEFLKESIKDCEDFINENRETLERIGAYNEGYAMEVSAGHDFWLTRCGHGTGFWDRGLGDIGDRLSDSARVYGNVDLYVGDDNLIYGS